MQPPALKKKTIPPVHEPRPRVISMWRAGARVLLALALLATGVQAHATQENCSGNLNRSNLANPLVELRTTLGSVCIELLEDQAPQTVANFLEYLRDGDIDGTFFHRSIAGFVLQGGGFRLAEGNELIVSANGNPPVPNEPCALDQNIPGTGGAQQRCSERGNVRGTLAMAKIGGNPDSATNQWFFNVADNRPNLDNQNGGFTVFARVLGSGMQVVDQIMALPRLQYSSYNLNRIPVTALSAFTTLPVIEQPAEPAAGFGCFDTDQLALLFDDQTNTADPQCSEIVPGFTDSPCERGAPVTDSSEPRTYNPNFGFDIVSGACGTLLAEPEHFCTGAACATTTDRFGWGVVEDEEGTLFLTIDQNDKKLPYSFTPAEIQASDTSRAERRAAMTAQSAGVMVFVEAAVLSPEIVAPVAGSHFTGSLQTFTWDPHDTVAQAWSIVLGSTPGGDDFGEQVVDDPDATELTFDNLPFAGQTVHATLSWKVDGQWRAENSRRYVFVAADLQDSDGDGVPNDTETLRKTDPNDPDSDDDGLDDGQEALLGTDPLDDDSDDDGLLDGHEVDLGIDPLVGDSDGDGLDDAFEVANGLDPGDVRDGRRDKDGDGFTNLEEEQQGTDLNDRDDWPMPVMLTPADLTGHTQMIDWSYPAELPLRRWRVRVGTTERGRQILGGRVVPGATTELEVNRLPTQGGAVFVEIALDRGRGFRNIKRFVFNAAELDPPGLTPDAGSLGGLQSGASATFALVRNDNDVTHWGIEAFAASASGRDRRVFRRSLRGSVDEIAVTGLPTFGEPLVVRLEYRLSAGPIQRRGFALQAASLGVPALVSPDPHDGSADLLATGNTEDGTVEFSWDPAGQPVLDWQLYLGTSRGGRDLYRSRRLRGDVLSVDTRRVFANPRVFARLVYRIRGQQTRFVDYLYNPQPGVLRPFYPSTEALGLIAPVRNDGADPFSASGRPCRGNERGGHEVCLQGGMMKAMTLPASVTGCDTVVVSDLLSAFEWVCRETTPVEVVSVGLAGTLADLIDTGIPGAPAFRPNQVTVTDDGVTVAQSALAPWWQTPVAVVPADGQMRDADTVYVIESAAAGVPLVMNRAPRSALVVAPGVVSPVTGAGLAGGSVVTVLRSSFAAVSGDFAATGESTVVNVDRSAFVMARDLGAADGATAGEGRRAVPGLGLRIFASHNVHVLRATVTGNDGAGMRIQSSTGVWIVDSSALLNGMGVHFERASGNGLFNVRVGHNDLAGVVINRSADNRLAHLVVNNNGALAGPDSGHGISVVHPSSRRNQIDFVQVFANAGDGIFLDGARNTWLAHITAFNNAGSGVLLERAFDTTVSSMVSLNNGAAGLGLVGRTLRSRVDDLVSAHNDVGVLLSGRSVRNAFSGLMRLGGNLVDCEVEARSGDLVDGSCVATGLSDHALTTDVNAAASLVGKRGDGGDGDGTASHADLQADPALAGALGPDDGIFSSRGFGRDGGVFPSDDHRGPCVAPETCRVWDGAARSGDAGNGPGPVLAGVLSLPEAGDVLAHRFRRTTVILRHASEVLRDGIGNDDGLCESGEACHLDLNVGAWQGDAGDGVPDAVIGFDLERPVPRAPPRVEDVTLDARTATTVTPP